MRRRAELFALVVAFGAAPACIRTAYDMEKDYARKFEPVQLDAPPQPSPTPLRTYRVRFWAERGYAAQYHWREKLDRQLERVNEYLEPSFSVKLVSVEVSTWDRQTGDEDLAGVLGLLQRQDSGEGVDWVIGLISPLPFATSSQHRLGWAQKFSKYFVIRGMEDATEAQQFEKAFVHLSEGEKEALYQDRKAHKELAVFIHEWGHTLGCMHDADPEGILFHEYSQQVRYLSPSAQAMIRIGLEHLTSGSSLAAWGLAANAYIQSGPHPDLDTRELQAWLDQAPSADGGVARRPARSTLNDSDRDALDRAVAQFNAHHPDEALALVRPVAEKNRDDPRAQGMLCGLRIAQRTPAREIIGQCGYSVELDPDNVPLRVEVALLEVDLEGRRAVTALAKAREKAKENPPPAASWANLAKGWARTLSVAYAEEAAERAGPADGMAELSEWARTTRRWVGLPPDAGSWGVPPDKEGEFVASFREGFEAAEARKLGPALVVLQEMQKDYPKAPGTLALACGVYPLAGMWTDARRVCRESVRAWDEVIPGQVGCALIAARMGAWDEAKEHFERAIELDPSKEALWKAARDAYQKGGRQRWLEDLKRRFQGRFLRSL